MHLVILNFAYIGLCLFVLGLLYPHLGSLMSLVGLYGMLLSAFGRLSWARYGRVNQTSFYFVMIGAIVFIISDVLLAFRKFDVLEFENIHAFIVGTYCVSQGLITYGLIEGNKKGKNKRD